MFQVIPVLEVSEPCTWCDEQGCYAASVWYGDCLLSFYTVYPKRLEPEALNATACEVLQELTKACRPGQETVIEPAELWKLIGNDGCLPCYWADFTPPLLIAYSSSVRIPEPVSDSPSETPVSAS